MVIRRLVRSRRESERGDFSRVAPDRVCGTRVMLSGYDLASVGQRTLLCRQIGRAAPADFAGQVRRRRSLCRRAERTHSSTTSPSQRRASEVAQRAAKRKVKTAAAVKKKAAGEAANDQSRRE